MQNTISRKLANMFESGQEKVDHRTQCPEYKLWTAVMLRALTDYVKFFDQWIAFEKQSKYNDRNEKRRIKSKVKLNLELNWLRWFIFGDASEEFTLAWIYEHCLLEQTTSLQKTRNNLVRLHQQNLEKNKQHLLFKEIYQIYKDHGPLADVLTHLRQNKLN